MLGTLRQQRQAFIAWVCASKITVTTSSTLSPGVNLLTHHCGYPDQGLRSFSAKSIATANASKSVMNVAFVVLHSPFKCFLRRVHRIWCHGLLTNVWRNPIRCDACFVNTTSCTGGCMFIHMRFLVLMPCAQRLEGLVFIDFFLHVSLHWCSARAWFLVNTDLLFFLLSCHSVIFFVELMMSIFCRCRSGRPNF